MADALPRRFGEFVLLERLGRGATGEVHLARRLDASKELSPVVIKTLHAELTRDEQFVKRFRHEAALAVRVRSPYVATVFAAGAVGEALYIAMEYVEGTPLSRLMFDLHANRPAPLEAAAGLVATALQGLETLHSATDDRRRPLGIVHRDISPKNLIAGVDGRVRLIDLGLGKSAVQDWKTRTGVVMGSVGYMAPEQIRAEMVDHRADLYAIGIVLFELLTGRAYIPRGPLPAMIAASIAPPFVPPSSIRPEIPRALDDIVRRAIALPPADRYSSAGDFLHALHRAVPTDASPSREFLRALCGDEIEDRRSRIEQLLTTPIHPADEEQGSLTTTVFARRDDATLPPTVIREDASRTTVKLARLEKVGRQPALLDALGRTISTRWASRLFMLACLLIGAAGGTIFLETFGRDSSGGGASSLIVSEVPVRRFPKTEDTPWTAPGHETVPAARTRDDGASSDEARTKALPQVEIAPPSHANPPTQDGGRERKYGDRSAPSQKIRGKGRRPGDVRSNLEPGDRTVALARSAPPAEVDEDDHAGLAAKTLAEIETRAAKAKIELTRDDPKVELLERILFDLSLIRASKDPVKALAQARALEKRLNGIQIP